MAEVFFTDNTFQTDVIKSSVPVMVDFYADWCGPCRMLGPVIEELAEEYEGKIKVGKVNVDENPEISQTFGIQSIPTILFFKEGKVVDKTVGVQSKDTLQNKLDALVG